MTSRFESLNTRPIKAIIADIIKQFGHLFNGTSPDSEQAEHTVVDVYADGNCAYHSLAVCFLTALTCDKDILLNKAHENNATWKILVECLTLAFQPSSIQRIKTEITGESSHAWDIDLLLEAQDNTANRCSKIQIDAEQSTIEQLQSLYDQVTRLLTQQSNKMDTHRALEAVISVAFRMYHYKASQKIASAKKPEEIKELLESNPHGPVADMITQHFIKFSGRIRNELILLYSYHEPASNICNPDADLDLLLTRISRIREAVKPSTSTNKSDLNPSLKSFTFTQPPAKDAEVTLENYQAMVKETLMHCASQNSPSPYLEQPSALCWRLQKLLELSGALHYNTHSKDELDKLLLDTAIGFHQSLPGHLWPTIDECETLILSLGYQPYMGYDGHTHPYHTGQHTIAEDCRTSLAWQLHYGTPSMPEKTMRQNFSLGESYNHFSAMINQHQYRSAQNSGYISSRRFKPMYQDSSRNRQHAFYRTVRYLAELAVTTAFLALKVCAIIVFSAVMNLPALLLFSVLAIGYYAQVFITQGIPSFFTKVKDLSSNLWQRLCHTQHIQQPPLDPKKATTLAIANGTDAQPDESELTDSPPKYQPPHPENGAIKVDPLSNPGQLNKSNSTKSRDDSDSDTASIDSFESSSSSLDSTPPSPQKP